MDKLEKLISLCKCGVFITANEHRDYYMTAGEKLNDLDSMELTEISDEDRAMMIKTDTIIEGQCYPETTIGSYLVVHYDLSTVLDRLISATEGERKTSKELRSWVVDFVRKDK